MTATGVDIPGDVLALMRKGRIEWKMEGRYDPGPPRGMETYYTAIVKGVGFEASIRGLAACAPVDAVWGCEKAREVFDVLELRRTKYLTHLQRARRDERDQAECDLASRIRSMLE